MQLDAYGNQMTAQQLVQPSKPIEHFVVDVLDAVVVAAKNHGYEHPLQLVNHESLFGIPIINVDIELKKGQVKTHASAKISEESRTGAPRIYAVQGFPQEILAVLHNLSPSASGGQGSARAQAVVKSNPDPQEGRGGLASQSSGAGVGGVAESEEAQADRQIAAAAITLIDIATVKAELRERSEARRYIGASSIGDDCSAYHALSLRGFPSNMPSPRLLRIFNDGHEVEAKVIKTLRMSGHDVIDSDEKGNQYAYVSHGGHHRAHLDGFVKLLGTEEWMTLEIKSMNAVMFKRFKKRGVKYSHPDYYDQCVDGLNLLRAEQVRQGRAELTGKCMLIAYCKDNSEYHAEIVRFDEKRAGELIDRVSAVTDVGHGKRASAYKEAYKCADCFKRDSCWSPTLTEHKCWHCAYASPVVTGRAKEWRCIATGQEGVETPCSRFLIYRPGVADAKP